MDYLRPLALCVVAKAILRRMQMLLRGKSTSFDPLSSGSHAGFRLLRPSFPLSAARRSDRNRRFIRPASHCVPRTVFLLPVGAGYLALSEMCEDVSSFRLLLSIRSLPVGADTLACFRSKNEEVQNLKREEPDTGSRSDGLDLPLVQTEASIGTARPTKRLLWPISPRRFGIVAAGQNQTVFSNKKPGAEASGFVFGWVRY